MESRGRKLLVLIVALVLVPVAFALGAARKGPNLVVSSPGAAPKALKAGTAVAVKVKVKNSGKLKAKASRLQLVLSRDAKRDPADTALAGALRVKALAKGKSATVKGKLTVPKTVVNGTYTLLVCADA